MCPRNLVFITLLGVCHLQLGAQATQVLTNAIHSPQSETSSDAASSAASSSDALPDDPSQELVPLAQPEPTPAAGTPVEWEAKRQEWANDTLTLTGDVVVHYRDYILRADSVVYNRKTTELEADGNLQLTGGPDDVLINATHGDMRLNMHTARFYDVSGSQGVRTMGHTTVYSTPNPLLFSGRVLLQTGEGNFKVIDGSITNCRLPHPDWRIIAHTIALDNNKASTSNAFFEFLGVPVFYLPYLHHPANETGRTSGLLTPVVGVGSSIRGVTLGEQMYWAINRSMDMVIGAEYYSKRGWAPNGDFRYKGPGLDHLTARWNALLDRGVEEPTTDPQTGQVSNQLVNEGGVDVSLLGREDLSPATRVSGGIEYLSSYVYRLVFDDNYSQAISSEVSSEVVLTHNQDGRIPTAWLDRFQSFASTTNGNEVKILRLPLLRYDVLDRPLLSSTFYWGLESSLGYLNRSEPLFHSRNVVRLDFYPHLSIPFTAGGWSFVPEVALRDTAYTNGQVPSLTGPSIVPQISHSALNRADLEASVDIRPPALEREFALPHWHRELRHVIEPELTYNYVGGIGAKARDVLLFDTTDIATDVNEAGFSLTQRFYVRPTDTQPCKTGDEKTADDDGAGKPCANTQREWASWQIAQEYFIDPNFGGALISGRRNVFNATLDLMGPTFLTSPRNIAPLVSRIRFEAIDNLRVQWDLDYDSIAGRIAANNLFAGYSFGRTTVGIGHALLNAVDERATSGAPSVIKSQQLQPFLEIGKPGGKGFNLALNGGYDFVQHEVQYGGVQANYNWNCCGLTAGYRRFELGTIGTTSRDETQWLYSFTLANFGAVGDIRRANSIFRDPTLPPAY
ncbi:MAG: LPS-assembly protein LptD [Terracidiphilus sp.]